MLGTFGESLCNSTRVYPSFNMHSRQIIARRGFRRVPGHGLPPNAAAYKHPMFKKSDPELMKSMKFGQKADSRKASQQLEFQNLPGPSSIGIFGQLQPTAAVPIQTGQVEDDRSCANFQSSRNPAPLQTMADAHQQQLRRLQQRQHLALAAERLASQSAAFGAFNAGHEIDSQIRDRLLLMGLPAGMSLAPSANQSFQSHPRVSRQSYSPAGPANPASINAIDRELRNALLLGSALPLSVGGVRRLSTSSAVQRENFLAAAAAAAALDSSRQPAAAAVATAGMMSHLNFDPARLFMVGGAGIVNRLSNLPENPAVHASLLPATQLTNQMGMPLRLQQQEGLSQQVGFSTHELWLLLQEQERQRMQNEHERRGRQHEHNDGHL
jgi:hypothetical protein